MRACKQHTYITIVPACVSYTHLSNLHFLPPHPLHLPYQPGLIATRYLVWPMPHTSYFGNYFSGHSSGLFPVGLFPAVLCEIRGSPVIPAGFFSRGFVRDSGKSRDPVMNVKSRALTNASRTSYNIPLPRQAKTVWPVSAQTRPAVATSHAIAVVPSSPGVT